MTEQAFVTALLSRSPKLAQTVALARAFRTMVREQRAGELDEWLLATDGAAMAGFAGGLKRDLAAVHAALSLPWSTGPVEGQISRLKTTKRTNERSWWLRLAAPSCPRSSLNGPAHVGSLQRKCGWTSIHPALTGPSCGNPQRHHSALFVQSTQGCHLRTITKLKILKG